MAVEHEEFNALLQKYARVMAAAIRRVCRERHRALVPDIEQEVHTALWKRLQSGKEITHPTSYLYKVALTTALAAVRKHVTEMTLRESHDLAAPEPESVFGNLLPAEQATLLGQILEKLPREEARAVRAHLAGFSHTEVASLYGWTGSVARHRIYRGIETLREKMKSEAANGQRATRES